MGHLRHVIALSVAVVKMRLTMRKRCKSSVMKDISHTDTSMYTADHLRGRSLAYRTQK